MSKSDQQDTRNELNGSDEDKTSNENVNPPDNSKVDNLENENQYNLSNEKENHVNDDNRANNKNLNDIDSLEDKDAIKENEIPTSVGKQEKDEVKEKDKIKNSHEKITKSELKKKQVKNIQNGNEKKDANEQVIKCTKTSEKALNESNKTVKKSEKSPKSRTAQKSEERKRSVVIALDRFGSSDILLKKRMINRYDHKSHTPNYTEQYTHLELKRIKEALNREVTKIKYPKRKDFQPYIFNNLNPYYNTRDVENLINAPDNAQQIGYYNRYTAINIVEPWVAHRMEHNIAPMLSRSLNLNGSRRTDSGSLPKIEKPSKEQISGSTLAPNFPKVIIKKPKNMNGPFYYHDIPLIRKEIKNKFNSKTRIEEDRKRTINDYYRMNLYQTTDSKMYEIYHAYLENTPGSKKALDELLPTPNKSNSNNDSMSKHEVSTSS